MNETAAIVVTYNRAALLDECISALLSSSCPSDILVIDNASTDDTPLIIKKYGDMIRYHNTGKNIGGAGGFNIGIKKAYEMGYKYFWLMDDDTIVKQDTLENIKLCVDLLHDGWGFISSKALWCDGAPCIMNSHTIDEAWENEVELFSEGIIRTKIATFVSFFVRREVVADVGLPVKEYFIWGDDTEYSLRISQKYPSYYCNNSIVTHKMHNNQGTARIEDISDKDRIKRMETSIRNDICTTRRSSGVIKELFMLVRLLKQMVRVLTGKNVEYRFQKLKTIFKGSLKGIVFFPKIEKAE